jgi:opacity protein-like surface antigen
VGLFAAIAVPVGSAAQQDIADIDYAHLSFRGIGFDVGYLWPNKVEPTESYSVRFDLGYAGPGLRIVPTLSYWSSRLNDGEITDFETRVADLVADQTGGPPPDLDLGTIEYSDFSIGIDGHVVWELPLDLLTYGGLGLTAHLINADGVAINGTFVEDFIDSLEPGFNLHLGTEYPITNQMRLYAVGRYEVMPDLQFFQIRGGWQFMIGPNAPGEGRGND